ncbi:MAG: hypothetical protein AAF492_31330, partial [Verrucomicrobiota bacterium]
MHRPIIHGLIATLTAATLHADEKKNPFGLWYEPPTDRSWNVELLLGLEHEPDYPGADSAETAASPLARA